MDILEHNRYAWTKQVEGSNKWTIPVGHAEIEESRRTGRVSLVLTPTKKVPHPWYPDLSGCRVLCLASGGGQQGPLLAAAGARVTVFDNCPAQLDRDRQVAERENLSISLEQGDMRDLSRFASGSFDLIFHPVSNCFIDTIRPVWDGCFRVLRSGGVLLSGFCNPLTYIFDLREWDEHKNLEVRYTIPYSDLEQLDKEQLEDVIKKGEPLEFGHSLEDQIGGQIDAGFVITGFFEDNAGGDLLDPFIQTFIATRAVKPA